MLPVPVEADGVGEPAVGESVQARTQRHSLAEVFAVREYLRAGGARLLHRRVTGAVVDDQHAIEALEATLDHRGNRGGAIERGNQRGVRPPRAAHAPIGRATSSAMISLTASRKRSRSS